MFKKISLVAFSFLLVAFIIFHHRVFQSTAELAFKFYIVHVLGQTIHYEKASLEGNQLVIHLPQIIGKDNLIAEKLCCKVNFQFKPLQLRLDIVLDKPQWTVPDAPDLLMDWIKEDFSSRSSWLPVHSRIEVNEGLIIWKPDEQNERRLWVDLKAENHKRRGLISLVFDPLQSQGQIQIGLNQNKLYQTALFSCQKLSTQDCQFLQTLLSFRWPQLRQIELLSSNIDGQFSVTYNENALLNLKLKDLHFNDIAYRLIPLETEIHFNDIFINGSSDLRQEKIWNSLNAEILLKDGKIVVDRGVKEPITISEIDTDLLVRKGVIERSPLHFNFVGFEGKVEIEGGSTEDFLTMHLTGSPKDLSLLLPKSIQSILVSNFPNDQCSIVANIKRLWKEIEIEGNLKIQEPKNLLSESINFGCHLDVVFDQNDITLLPKGWFNTKNIALDKYLTPFLFPNRDLLVYGIGEFKGNFNKESIVVKYTARDLRLENEHLLMENPLVSQVGLEGIHHFDLKTGNHYGTLPIHNGSYYDKSSGLLFSDIRGLIHFKDKNLEIKPIEAFCHDINFGGAVNLDYSNPNVGEFSLALNIPQVSGKFSQVQQLLSHLDHPELLTKVALDGNVEAKNSGVILQFDFFPKDFDFFASIEGSLNQGFMPIKEGSLSIQGLDFDFNYNQDSNLLVLSELQGTLLAGKLGTPVEYGIESQKILFKGNEADHIELDIRLKDQNNCMMRLAGISSTNQDGQTHWLIDKALSHFANVHPTRFQLVTTDQGVDQFNLNFELELSNFLKEVNRLVEAGVFPGSEDVKNWVWLRESQGTLQASIHYDQVENLTSYEMYSDNLQWRDHSFSQFILKGRKQDKKWMLDRCQLDDFSLFAELHHENEKWKINTLGINQSDVWQLGLEGLFSLDPCHLKAKIKLIDLNLDKIAQLKTFSRSICLKNLNGFVKGNGELEISFLSHAPWVDIIGRINTDLKDVFWKNYQIKSNGTIGFELLKNQLLQIQNLSLSLVDENKKVAELNNSHIYFAIADKQLNSFQSNFNVPAGKSRTFFTWLQKCFPDSMSDSSKEFLVGFKLQEDLRGGVNIERGADDVFRTRILLSDGLYRIKQQKWDLKDVNIEISGRDASFSAFSNIERAKISILGEALWPGFSEGTVSFSEVEQPQSPPLVVKWSEKGKSSPSIDSLEGQIYGVRLSLNHLPIEKNPPYWSALEGEISFDPDRMKNLLSPSLAAKIEQLQIAGICQLKGICWMNSQWGRSFEDALYFQGNLHSQNLLLKGYLLDQLTADVEYVPGQLTLSHFEIQDQSGLLVAPQSTFTKSNEIWSAAVPTITIKNFIPSLLRDSASKAPVLSKSLLVKEMEFHNFNGQVDNTQTWRGEGNLHFLNPTRKNSQPHPVLVIPAELILRLGLNPRVLNPVTGKISFKILGDRFYLTRFKDVYSEGKGSKFTLAESTKPSWVDFDGNLSVQIKMKQYNLMFKLAELFNVSVEGSLKKPRYVLYKHGKER